MNVLALNNTISVHKCHVGLLHFLPDFITFASSATYTPPKKKIVLIFNFMSSNYEFRQIQLMHSFL